uniref:Uncharacterized protein n=1 Tax=Setaria viridis TaxID=4556 RepID=A0A4U6WHX6_SETVI|nr:hypothetical protein SEVIR_1G277500v2 [Setaria viridis]
MGAHRRLRVRPEKPGRLRQRRHRREVGRPRWRGRPGRRGNGMAVLAPASAVAWQSGPGLRSLLVVFPLSLSPPVSSHAPPSPSRLPVAGHPPPHVLPRPWSASHAPPRPPWASPPPTVRPPPSAPMAAVGLARPGRNRSFPSSATMAAAALIRVVRRPEMPAPTRAGVRGGTPAQGHLGAHRRPRVRPEKFGVRFPWKKTKKATLIPNLGLGFK